MHALGRMLNGFQLMNGLGSHYITSESYLTLARKDSRNKCMRSVCELFARWSEQTHLYSAN